MLVGKSPFSVAVLILLAGVQAQHDVTFSSQSICAVTGSTVQISCTFTTDYLGVKQWYRDESPERVPQDLSKNPQYSRRVSVNTWRSSSRLTLKDVTVNDSGVYNFGTHRSGWTSASSGVRLTITDLQVKVDLDSVRQKKVKVTCSAACSLSAPHFYWYSNGRYFSNTKDASIELDSTNPQRKGSYTCRVARSSHVSPEVCVLGKLCWGVTYSRNHVCGLKEASIDLSCSYKHPAVLTVLKFMWFIKEQADGEDVDVTEDEEYQGRVQYTQSSQNNCSLRISNLREKDAQTYRFRFYTNEGEFTGERGISLSVTDLKITVSDWYSQTKLHCITTCTPSNYLTYIWWKNGHHVQHQLYNELLVSPGRESNYSCAIKGYEEFRSPAVYSPKNTTAVVLPSGNTVQGDSVTLSCGSDANPPVHTYYWFKQEAAADTLLTTGGNYSIRNISSQHSGLYYCTAHNLLGQHNSTLVYLDALYAPRNLSVTVVPSESGDLITLLCTSDSNPTSSYTWSRKTDGGVILIRNTTNVTLPSGADGVYCCTARNRIGASSSELSYTSGSGAVKYIGSAVTVLLLSFIVVALWMRKSTSSRDIRSEQNNKNDSAHVYDNISAMTSDPTHTASSEDQDTEVQYSSVYFKHSHTQDVPLYSTVQPPKSLNQEEEVEYATVNLVKSRAVREDEIYTNLQSEA